MTAPNNLKRRLSVAFALDEQSLVTSILAQRSETWRSTLTSEARAAGSSKSGVGPNGKDASHLSQLSREDAASIVNTYNRELNNLIDRLYDANPIGDRAYYIAEISAWAAQRAEYKDRQIANMNRSTARTYAQERFNDENKSGEALYLFDGPPAREPVCEGLFRAGLVDRTFIERNPTPVHINCPHTWEVQTTRVGVPIADIWVG
jgi:hypothetical protein